MTTSLIVVMCIIYMATHGRLKEGRSSIVEGSNCDKDVMLIDFTDGSENLEMWSEVSDIVRTAGKSKAALVDQTSRLFKRAIFFTLLNPQPNGAGFAGVRRSVMWDLSSYSNFVIRIRGQGQNKGYKISLRHKGEDSEPYPAYEHFFVAPMGEFAEVKIPIAGFKPYYRGKKLTPEDVINLDVTNITKFELQMYGGVYSVLKQSGASSLEIDWLKVR